MAFHVGDWQYRIHHICNICRDAHACWMCSSTRKNKVRNENVGAKVGVAPVEDCLVMCDVDLQVYQIDEGSLST